ncbi:AsmA-like C-terminal region-containing protein [Nitrospira sp. MA-1]|nr:AsmA-like C-terminal region-containing protein [Nitrospira sp. MA-1]
MFRPSRKFWISLALIFVTCGVLAYVLFPFIKTELYRETLERGFSAAMGRTVSLEGPLSLTFSLHPRLILEHVSVSNPPWTSQPHFLRADRLEIGLSLVPLLQRRLEAEKIALEGAELFLEEGSEGLDNWTFRKDSQPGIVSRAAPSVFMTISNRGEISIESSRIRYRSYPAGETTDVAIHRGVVNAPDDQHRKFSVEGTYQDSPVNIELIGGRIMDLFTLTEAWPFDGVLFTTGASASIKGSVGGANSDQMYDLQVQINGDRLSALNALLNVGLPDSAPFMIAANVVKISDVLNLNNIRGTLGSSDLGGQLRIQNGVGRQKMTGRLTSNSLQIHDLTSLSHTNGSQQAASLEQPEFKSSASMPLDVDLDVIIPNLLLGETDIGSLSLTAGMQEDQVLLDPIQMKSFGGTLQANLEVDLKNSAPRTRLKARFSSFNFGEALEAFGVPEGIAGQINLDVLADGHGTTLQESLSTLNVDMRMDRTTISRSESIPENRLPVAFPQLSLRISKGGPIEIRGKGTFQDKTYGVRLMTGSLIEMIEPRKPWPISLTAQRGDAVLAATGTLNPDRPEMGGTLGVSLKGKNLSELHTDLPAVGPYHFKARVTKEGPRYRMNDFQSRFGTSDLSGTLEVATEKNPPQFTGTLNAEHVNFRELSTPGDTSIPTEAFSTANGNLKLKIYQANIGEFQLSDLIVDAKLHAGLLTVKDVQGTLFNQQSSYGNFQGRLDLDTTKPIPSVSGQMTLSDIKYEYVFSDVQFVNPNDHVINLHAKFSSVGTTVDTLLAQPTVSLTGHNLQVRLHGGTNRGEPLDLRSNLLVESVTGGPLRLYAEGRLENTPFRLRFSGGQVSDLMNNKEFWPVNIRADVPRAMAELSGYVALPHPGEKFSFQIHVKGDNLRDLDFMATSDLPDAGPLEISGLVTKSSVGYHVTNFEGSLAGSNMSGDVTVLTKGIRPRVNGKLTAENLVLDAVKQPLDDSSAQQKRSTLKSIGDSVKGIGSSAVNIVRDTIGMPKKSEGLPLKSIPDGVFPVEDLRAIDLLLDVGVKHLRKGEEDLGHASFQIALEEGLLALQPVTGNFWGGAFEGKLILDGTQYVPTLDVHLHVQGLDYERVARSFGGSDLVKGQSQSIKLALKGRGDTLHEVLEQASGHFELVDGPLELATKYIDLWAADLITTALTTAWKSESVTKLNCTVGYFDIEEGVVKSEDILIDSHRLTVAGIGKLDLADETMDLLLTPRPKDPSLFSLAHTVRITGPLTDPDVSSDKLRIAESGGWGLLGLVNPLGWIIAIPQIAGTTVGTMNQNPCVEALKGRQQTAQALDEIKGGLWGRIKGIFSSPRKSSD